MRRPMRGLGLMALMMAAAAGTNGIYDTRRRPAEVKPRDNTRAKKLYHVDCQEHEFIIHGEAIMAKNRKTALKIYTNRHKSDFHKNK